MADIKDKLSALLGHKGLMTGAQWKQQAQVEARRREEGAFEIDHVVPGRVEGDGDFGFYLVRNNYPLDARQGAVRLNQAFDIIPEHAAIAACDSDLDGFDASKAVFIDTETTGLSGGTGTVAFLIGVGYFVEDVFRLDQCFMRDYDDEEPMLAYLDGLFKQAESLVSYNGKSFDVPLLRTRFIQNRIPFRLDALPHFDLVHAARRFWRARLQDCSLGNVEREVLGIRRQGDVPSAEIPELWLEYLRSRDARKLERVFYHHQMDILSLVALAATISQTLLAGEEGRLEYAEDHLSMVRLHFRQRNYEEVVRQGQGLLEAESGADLRRECLELMGFALKRLARWVDMQETWERLLQEAPRDPVACLELAKHHEHRTRNLSEADRLCAEAIAFMEEGGGFPGEAYLAVRYLDALQHRLARIRGKLERAGGANP